MFKKAVVVCLAALVALLGMPAAQAVAVPTAEQQLNWLVDASGRVPVSDAEIREHMAPAYVDLGGGPVVINAVLTRLGRFAVDEIVAAQPNFVVGRISVQAEQFITFVQVDQAGLIDLVDALLLVPTPTSWEQVDEQLATLGARVSFGASEIGADGRCRVLHGSAADVPRPLGSAFKLYVLGALGQAVSEHRASWTEQLAIRDSWKSLRSLPGDLQDQPAGTRLPLARYADNMIFISDNTATDHLIHRLGRDAVERQLFLFGNHQPFANIPFLTTKALFELKATRYPARADAYLALPRPARPGALAVLERLPLTGLTGWLQPRKIDQLEWFGSPGDICRAFSGLRAQNQPEIDHAMSLNDGSLGLDPSRFPTVWYKGGSEQGVLTLNYLTRTATGRTLVTSIMVSDPANPLDEFRTVGRGVAIARAAFQLMSP
jgi:hypothetical protein